MSSTRMEPSPVVGPQDAGERLAGRLIGRPLSIVVGLLCAVQYATWAPSYLTWPFWADHDVFDTAAHCWDVGILPYKDLFGNNFPGTTYILWALGKAFGWTCTPAFYAFDAVLVAALGFLMGFWSRRNFGSRLPGLIGYATFLGYYFELDYSQVAQRDWQGPFFAVAAILLLQSIRGRPAILPSGLMMAFAATIRPQVIFFLPGIVATILERSRGEDGIVEKRPAFVEVVGWGIVVTAGLAVAAVPLLKDGIFDDFLRQIRLVVPGGSYHSVTRKRAIEEFVKEIAPFRVLAVPMAILLLGRVNREGRRGGPDAAWLWTFASVLLYSPLSPQIHAYLRHPINLTWSILVAVLTARIRSTTSFAPMPKLVALVLVMGMGISLRPRYCNPIGGDSPLGVLRTGRVPTIQPPGYVHNPLVPASGQYSWSDYRDMLRYIRSLPPEIRVANVLKYVPAIAGPTGRLPVFPAESIAWLYMIRKEDEQLFADRLREALDSVVVWAPSEREPPLMIRLEILTPVIEEHYEPDRRFGPIEVWRRKPAEPAKDRP